jgi:hypothetical protein
MVIGFRAIEVLSRGTIMADWPRHFTPTAPFQRIPDTVPAISDTPPIHSGQGSDGSEKLSEYSSERCPD